MQAPSCLHHGVGVKNVGTAQSCVHTAGSAWATALSADWKPVFLLCEASAGAPAVPTEAFRLFCCVLQSPGLATVAALPLVDAGKTEGGCLLLMCHSSGPYHGHFPLGHVEPVPF